MKSVCKELQLSGLRFSYKRAESNQPLPQIGSTDIQKWGREMTKNAKNDAQSLPEEQESTTNPKRSKGVPHCLGTMLPQDLRRGPQSQSKIDTNHSQTRFFSESGRGSRFQAILYQKSYQKINENYERKGKENI